MCVPTTFLLLTELYSIALIHHDLLFHSLVDEPCQSDLYCVQFGLWWSIFVDMFLFLLSKHLGMRWLHIWHVRFYLDAILLKWLCYLAFRPIMPERSICSASSSGHGNTRLFHFNHSSGCEVVSNCLFADFFRAVLDSGQNWAEDPDISLKASVPAH